MYLYPSSTKPSLVIIGWVGTYYSKRGKARKCLQRTEQRVLLQRGLCVADTGPANRSPPSTANIHWNLEIKACERDITEDVLWLQQQQPVVVMHWYVVGSMSSFKNDGNGFVGARNGGEWVRESMHVCDFKMVISCAGSQIKINILSADKWSVSNQNGVSYRLRLPQCAKFCWPKLSKYLHSFVHCPSAHCCLQLVNKMFIMLMMFFMRVLWVPNLFPGWICKSILTTMEMDFFNVSHTVYLWGFISIITYKCGRGWIQIDLSLMFPVHQKDFLSFNYWSEYYKHFDYFLIFAMNG